MLSPVRIDDPPVAGDVAQRPWLHQEGSLNGVCGASDLY